MAQRIIQDLPRLMQARRTSLGMSMRDVAREVELAPAPRSAASTSGRRCQPGNGRSHHQVARMVRLTENKAYIEAIPEER